MTSQPVLIFDLDDTLIHTDVLRRHVDNAAKPWGISRLANRAAGKKIRQTGPFTMQRLAKELFPGDTSKSKTMVGEFNKLFLQSHTLIYPGVLPFLKSLSKRYKLVLLTYGNPMLQRRKIKATGLGPIFQKIIITDSDSKLAPLVALNKQANTHLLFIENSDIACKTARSMGIKVIKVKRGFKDQGYFAALKSTIIKKLG